VVHQWQADNNSGPSFLALLTARETCTATNSSAGDGSISASQSAAMLSAFAARAIEERRPVFRAVVPEQSADANAYIRTVERALANLVHGYVFSNPEQFQGGTFGPHGIERVISIIGRKSNWTTLGVRTFTKGEDL